MPRIADTKLIKIPVIRDSRGNLSSIESNKNVPFEIKRVYYLYDIPGSTIRGGNAHHQLNHVIFALSGSFDIVLDDGYHSQKIHLNRPYNRLFIPELIWRNFENFSSAATCLVIASENYEATDYIRSYDEYINMVNPSKGRNR
jgi:dTDP-4-dehydrorhamnose 3,5-epimerase-like enzyme